MTTTPKSPTEITDKILNEPPVKALVFLRGVSTNAVIRDLLAKYGYTDDAHNQGWALVFTSSGYAPGVPADNPAAQAISDLSDWCSVGFHRVHAALAHLYPTQEDYVFQDLDPATGAPAIVAV